jgi:hypothetical protein
MNDVPPITTEREFTALALVAGSELANKWLCSLGEAESNVRNMLANGAGLEMVLMLHPVPSVDMRLIDTDGSRVRLAGLTVTPTAKH